ncbi:MULTISPECIES: hypothetical protein [Mycobacteroides]|uniref:hypothetical protein n=1 Tax=Mycobacteroides TaxID=670516 RepID=UPI0008A9F42E|nr:MULTISPECIES: hypothetical protein [Mycobacteroides]AYM40338.1 hypothetical protein DYE20_01145 [[Mycobacterium] chelonae subsp. gwanakae]OHU15923.1 hypothetical protein BKG75_12810 [Mycobacteroides chelonae]SIF25670.1 Uncharacterised protein [Mycobacteroides abscessus subsp. abscessus]SIF38854.1 Uncharacterised protein [Mycobacteroides abscessus subsp. abscessus]SIF83505.1 Uncharacterised protein [Mycobacteroides abscessus subsp. abscessus]
MTTLTPDISALWRTAGSRIAAAGLPPNVEHRDELVLVAGAYAAAQAVAYAAETDLHQVLAFELLAGGAFPAYGALSRVELQAVEHIVARTWRLIAVEVGRLRGGLGVAA